MMGYIWNDYSADLTYRVAAEHISPYMEVWQREGNMVYVNIFYRIFHLLLPDRVFRDGKELSQYLKLYIQDERYQDIANLLIHYIAQMDRLRGMRLEDAADSLHREEILNGGYGEWAKQSFEKLEPQYQGALLRCLTEYSLCAQRETVFDAALHTLFKGARLYYEHPTKTVYIYLDEKKTETTEIRYQLCEFFFKDMFLKTSVMWQDEHFGIIGWEETMEVCRTALI